MNDKGKKNAITKMSLEECIKVAKEMQRWRKGEKPYDGITPEDDQCLILLKNLVKQ